MLNCTKQFVMAIFQMKHPVYKKLTKWKYKKFLCTDFTWNQFLINLFFKLLFLQFHNSINLGFINYSHGKLQQCTNFKTCYLWICQNWFHEKKKGRQFLNFPHCEIHYILVLQYTIKSSLHIKSATVVFMLVSNFFSTHLLQKTTT